MVDAWNTVRVGVRVCCHGIVMEPEVSDNCQSTTYNFSFTPILIK